MNVKAFLTDNTVYTWQGFGSGRIRKARGAVLAGTVLLAFAGLFCPKTFGEEDPFIDGGGDVVIEEYSGDDGWDDQGGTPVSGERKSKKRAGEADDDAPLIEDEAFEVVREGADLEEVLKAEEEAEAAARAVQDFMDREAIYIPGADPAATALYLQNLLKQPSPTGSDGELIISRYISETMKGLGYTVSEQTFHEGFLNESMVDVPGVNIIAERGADSEHRSGQIVIICAHYDSRTPAAGETAGSAAEGVTAETAGSAAEGITAETADGAAQTEAAEAGTSVRAGERLSDPLENDKTGAAVLLECARILADVPSDVDLCFLFCSGEEDGNFGSLRFAEELKEDIKGDIRAVICVGPVGYKSKVSGQASENETESETETEAAGSRERVLPYRLGTVTGLGNEPANLLRSTALFQKAENMLGVPEGETDALVPMEEAGAAAFEGDPADVRNAETGIEEAAALEDLLAQYGFTQNDAVDTEQTWDIVRAEEGMHKAFADAGMSAVYLYQDVAALADDGEAGNGAGSVQDAGTPESTGQESVQGAETPESGQAGAQGEAGNKVVWLDMTELTKAAELLAQTIGLYMQLP